MRVHRNPISAGPPAVHHISPLHTTRGCVLGVGLVLMGSTFWVIKGMGQGCGSRKACAMRDGSKRRIGLPRPDLEAKGSPAPRMDSMDPTHGPLAAGSARGRLDSVPTAPQTVQRPGNVQKGQGVEGTTGPTCTQEAGSTKTQKEI